MAPLQAAAVGLPLRYAAEKQCGKTNQIVVVFMELRSLGGIGD